MALLSVTRRWHFREGMPIREIERCTGLSRNTIRKYLRAGTVEPMLAGLRDPDRSPMAVVTARDRDTATGPDAVLSTLDQSDYDQLWLFAVDTGEGLDAEDCAAISRFRKNGGGLMVTRDHMDLGSSVCTLGGVDAH